jgi:FAD binding domain/Berberine and berberine like
MAIGGLERSSVALDMTAARGLRAAVHGTVLLPGDDGYDSARRVFNAMIDKRPALIIRCAGTADVIRGVDFARTHELPLSVRGGGHGVAGRAVCDGGVMLDLSPMKGVRVDPARRTAEAQAGLLLAELDHETQAFGLATPLGVVSVTGIAGLTLGGGEGWLNGLYGLSCDNVLAADVVTADGELLTASADEHEDLYWGIRGGSGNFGVVTSFTYRLHPVGTVLGGVLRYPWAKAREVLRCYREFADSCPDDLSTTVGLGTAPDGGLILSIRLAYCGEIAAGERAVQPLRTFGRPLEVDVRPMTYCAVQRMSDAAWPAGRQHYWKSAYAKDLSDDVIAALLEFMPSKPSPTTAVAFQQIHGAAARVDPSATAYPHRDEHHNFEIVSNWDDPADSARNIEWTRAFFEAMQPFLERGVYINALGEEGDDRVKAAYGANYERLAALKQKYDPTNFFHATHTVRPAG